MGPRTSEPRGSHRDLAPPGPHDRYLQALAWAKANVTGESPALAASAALSLKVLRQRVTVAAVRRRLQAQGRDRATLAPDHQEDNEK